MSAAPWGASPGEWTHFAQHLGLVRDLLPVVSNPKAAISSRSKMRDLGKTPSRYNPDREVVGIPSWTSCESTEKQVALWARDSDLGICLQTRVVRAIDVDVDDPVQAARVAEFIELGLGIDLPRRQRADSGKFLLTLQMPGAFAKRVIRTAHGAIEFLADGQQFIAIGTHPKGARYEWPAGLPAEIPDVTPAEFEALWQGLVDAFALPGGSSLATRGVLPSIPRSALDMHGDPMVAFLQENNWVREFDRDGRVHITCPWADQHTSDSGPSSTSYFPAGVGGINAGHFKCLHAHCTGRDDGAFQSAIGWTTSLFEVVEAATVGEGGEPAPAEWPAFVRSRGGQIEAELNNVLMALRRPDICGLRIGFDNFKGMLMAGKAGTWRTFSDNDYTALRSTLASRGFKPVSPEMIKDAVRYVGDELQFDSATEWADGLEWDGVERVETFYSDFFGVPDSPYTRAVARYTWSALAARCLEPGAKCDMVPVFIGLQGAGKTTVVEALSPIDDAFVEINLERKDDDLARSLRGKLVGEIAELRGLQGRDSESIKAWISRRWEEWTPKWREFSHRYPRRLLMFGTGNSNEFLDDTEERRWLPMVVGKIDVAAVRAVCPQLWAEGVAMYRAGGVHWQDAYTLARDQHAAFKVSDPWDDVIAQWLNSDAMDGPDGPKRGDDPVRIVDVLIGALGFKFDRIDRRCETRVGKVLRRLGYDKRVVRVNGVSTKAWKRTHAPEDIA